MVADKLWRGLVASLVEHWAPVGRPPLLLDATLGNASGRKVDGAGFFKLAPPRTGRRGRPRTSMGSPLKKGVASVGVPRQGCGTAGKVESCQIGIFLRSPSEPSPMGTPPRPPLARRPRCPRLLPGPGPHRALAPGPGDGGLDPVGRGAVPQRGEGGDRAGPGRGPALAEPAPAPHLIDAGRCLVGLTVPERRRLLVVAVPAFPGAGRVTRNGRDGDDSEAFAGSSLTRLASGAWPPSPRPLGRWGPRAGTW